MSLITTAAYLQFCSCGGHCRIISKERDRSPEFATQHDGFRIAENAVNSGRLSREEVLHLKAEIRNSSLPLYNADSITEITVCAINEVGSKIVRCENRLEGEQIPDSEFSATDFGDVVN